MSAWFSTFARGWGAAELAFMSWMIRSGRMARSAFWAGVDSWLIRDQFAAAFDFVHGIRYVGDRRIQNWLTFMQHPSAAGFWAAHNTTIVSGATSAAGRGWFRREPLLEQFVINDAMVNLVRGTKIAALLASHGFGWCNDPRTGCIGGFLSAFYPSYYPVSIWWWGGVVDAMGVGSAMVAEGAGEIRQV